MSDGILALMPQESSEGPVQTPLEPAVFMTLLLSRGMISARVLPHLSLLRDGSSPPAGAPRCMLKGRLFLKQHFGGEEAAVGSHYQSPRGQ